MWMRRSLAFCGWAPIPFNVYAHPCVFTIITMIVIPPFWWAASSSIHLNVCQGGSLCCLTVLKSVRLKALHMQASGEPSAWWDLLWESSATYKKTPADVGHDLPENLTADTTHKRTTETVLSDFFFFFSVCVRPQSFSIHTLHPSSMNGPWEDEMQILGWRMEEWTCVCHISAGHES